MKKVLLIISLFCISLSSFTQEKVTFYSADGLKVTADLYLSDYQNPFILLFHQAGSSRGEFKEIAPRLKQLGYNCLAVDLRSGGKSNYVLNETAAQAKKDNLPDRFIDAKQDIEASISYLKKFNKQDVILFGSSYSASLSLIIGNEMDNVKAVIAFSPGEYFRPEMEVKRKLNGFNKPVFIGTTDLEYRFAKEMMMDSESPLEIIFKPSEGRGIHGARALWDESTDNKEYWFQLSYFFSQLKEI